MASLPSASSPKNWGTAYNEFLVVEHGTDGTHSDVTADSLIVKDPWFDIRAYGAMVDGSTDDLTAVNAAIAAANLAGGGVVFFPTGTTVCSDQLTALSGNSVTLKGTGRYSSVLKYTGTDSPFIQLTSGACGIEDLRITYSNAGFSGTLIDTNGQSRQRFNKCWFEGDGQDAATYLLDLDAALFTTINGTFFGAAVYGIRGQAAGGASYSNVVNISACDFGNYTTAAILNPGIAWHIGNGTAFSANASDETRAIAMDTDVIAYGLSIDSSYFADATDAGPQSWIEFLGFGLSVKGCYINGTGDKTNSGITLIGDSSGISVTGNYFSDLLYAVDTANAPTITDISIKGNRTRNMATADVKFDTIIKTAMQPEIDTLADDATPSIAAGQNTWLTGGTTTITDFDDGVVGQTITIIAEHSITITDGTNIFLSGSGNFAMTATDTLTLIQKADGKWYEVARGDNGA